MTDLAFSPSDHPHDHPGVVELLGAYALDAVDNGDREHVERILRTCSRCRAEVDDHREIAALLADPHTMPPPGGWQRLAGRLASEDAAPRLPALGSRHRRTSRSTRSIRLAVAAAFLAVVASAAVALQQTRITALDQQLAAERTETAALRERLDSDPISRAAGDAMAEDDSRLVALASPSGTADAIIVLREDGTGYLTGDSLRPLTSEETYQLWAIVNGEVISAAVLGNDPGIVPFRIDVEGLQGFAITAERAGGVAVSTQDAVASWLASA